MISFDHITDLYKPVVRGLQHLTALPSEPPDGTTVVLLDGDEYVVGSVPPSPAVYACHICYEEWLTQILPARSAPTGREGSVPGDSSPIPSPGTEPPAPASAESLDLACVGV